ncbi:hypothetical protein NRB20_63000 [Nocardia sp. RB20]|uniref:Uncharacterized protein n=1 Tax=Nocardia macrotermitis TaxID=2585198 RepID=A0A7K0DBK7_9NOCA|nr:hypothetical protein [Nocardia macrotermitis]
MQLGVRDHTQVVDGGVAPLQQPGQIVVLGQRIGQGGVVRGGIGPAVLGATGDDDDPAAHELTVLTGHPAIEPHIGTDPPQPLGFGTLIDGHRTPMCLCHIGPRADRGGVLIVEPIDLGVGAVDRPLRLGEFLIQCVGGRIAVLPGLGAAGLEFVTPQAQRFGGVDGGLVPVGELALQAVERRDVLPVVGRTLTDQRGDIVVELLDLVGQLVVVARGLGQLVHRIAAAGQFRGPEVFSLAGRNIVQPLVFRGVAGRLAAQPTYRLGPRAAGDVRARELRRPTLQLVPPTFLCRNLSRAPTGQLIESPLRVLGGQLLGRPLTVIGQYRRIARLLPRDRRLGTLGNRLARGHFRSDRTFLRFPQLLGPHPPLGIDPHLLEDELPVAHQRPPHRRIQDVIRMRRRCHHDQPLGTVRRGDQPGHLPPRLRRPPVRADRLPTVRGQHPPRGQHRGIGGLQIARANVVVVVIGQSQQQFVAEFLGRLRLVLEPIALGHQRRPFRGRHLVDPVPRLLGADAEFGDPGPHRGLEFARAQRPGGIDVQRFGQIHQFGVVPVRRAAEPPDVVGELTQIPPELAATGRELAFLTVRGPVAAPRTGAEAFDRRGRRAMLGDPHDTVLIDRNPVVHNIFESLGGPASTLQSGQIYLRIRGRAHPDVPTAPAARTRNRERVPGPVPGMHGGGADHPRTPIGLSGPMMQDLVLGRGLRLGPPHRLVGHGHPEPVEFRERRNAPFPRGRRPPPDLGAQRPLDLGIGPARRIDPVFARQLVQPLGADRRARIPAAEIDPAAAVAMRAGQFPHRLPAAFLDRADPIAHRLLDREFGDLYPQFTRPLFEFGERHAVCHERAQRRYRRRGCRSFRLGDQNAPTQFGSRHRTRDQIQSRCAHPQFGQTLRARIRLALIVAMVLLGPVRLRAELAPEHVPTHLTGIDAELSDLG